MAESPRRPASLRRKELPGGFGFGRAGRARSLTRGGLAVRAREAVGERGGRCDGMYGRY